MKKMLMIMLALGLVVGLAVPATATDWSARGHIFVGGAIHRTVPPAGGPNYFPDRWGNVLGWGPAGVTGGVGLMPWGPPWNQVINGYLTPAGDAWNDTFAWVRMGANLTITAAQSEDLYGVLSFNFNSDRWGEFGNDVNELGSWYRMGHDDGGTNSVLINDCFIDFRVPPKLPVWLRVGIQPYVIRPWLLVMSSGPGITGRVTIDPIKLSINAGWAKKWEGYDWDADDIDAFFFDMGLPIGPVRIGGFAWYENHNVWLPTVFNNAQFWTAAAINAYPDSGARDEADLFWLGVYADGRIGPVGLQFDFIYSGGDIEYDADWATILGVPTPRDQDIDAWVVRGVVDVSPIPKLMVGVGGLYATGEDFNTNDIEEFQGVGGYEATRQQGYPMLEDFVLLTGGVMGIVPARGPLVGYIGGPQGIGGVWYVRGFAQYMATDWLRLLANFGWIGDTRDDWNKFGTAIDPGSTSGLRDDSEIGFEFDLGFNIALYKNLQWGVAFGYLFANKALDQVDPVALTNEDPADPWAITSALLYTF
jgi:hypothetical protein